MLGAVDAARAMTIAGILFDKDGTLVDFNRTWMRPYQRAAAFLESRFGVAAGELMKRGGFIAESGTWRPDSPLASGSNAAIIDCWAEACGAPIDGDARRAVEALFHLRADEYAPAVDDLPALLSALRAAGIAIGVATMDNEANARRMLQSAGADALVDFVCGADSGYGLKPAPGMARAFCDVCALRPARMMVVGDSPKDINMGRAADAGFTVGVLTGAHTAADLACADRTLSGIAEVPALVRELNAK